MSQHVVADRVSMSDTMCELSPNGSYRVVGCRRWPWDIFNAVSLRPTGRTGADHSIFPGGTSMARTNTLEIKQSGGPDLWTGNRVFKTNSKHTYRDS